MTRVFLAGIFHETHSFTGETTGIEGFVIHRGQALLDRLGDASQVDGFLTVAKREGWEVVPSVTYTGGASGTVDHAVFEAFWSEVKPLLEKALAKGLDAIHLSLHGAMVTSACDDPEGELMARIPRHEGGGASARLWRLRPARHFDAPHGRLVGLHHLLPRMSPYRCVRQRGAVERIAGAAAEDRHRAEASCAGDAHRLATHPAPAPRTARCARWKTRPATWNPACPARWH